MFQKPGSSTHSRGKKCKDVALRKSERRQLRRTVGGYFTPNDTTELAVHSQTDEILDAVFLQGSLVSRNIDLHHAPTPASSSGAGPASTQLPRLTTATLYFREPDAPNSVVGDGSFIWPYGRHAQCVWIQLMEEPQHFLGESSGKGRGIGNQPNAMPSAPLPKQIVHDLPGLALLSVLPGAYLPSVLPEELGAAFDAFALRRVLLNNAGVSRHLCRGAHLMWAGMRVLPGPAHPVEPQDRRGGYESAVIYCRGNPQPLAVGLLLPVSTGTHTRSGVGVFIVQCYGDDLWRQQSMDLSAEGPINQALGDAAGTPFDAGHYGNAGFQDGTHVVPMNDDDTVETEADECFEVITMDDVADSADKPDTEPADEMIEESLDKLSMATPVSHLLTPEDILHQAVCKALAMLHAKRDLPMTMANFYANHVIPNRPDGTLIELKQTRWKKFGVYVKEKVDSGLLVVGPDDAKTDPMAMLIDFNPRASTDVMMYRERPKSDPVDDTKDAKLVMMDLYIVPPHFVSQLQLDPEEVKAANATSEERRNTGMLTLKEVRSLLEKYIDKEKLISADRMDMVHMNGPLLDILYGKQNKQDAPATLQRKDLTRMWQSKQQAAYALVETPGSRVVRIGRGSPPTIKIVVAQRRKNKFETRIRGLEEFGIHAPSFQTDVSHRFACSGSIVEDAPVISSARKDHMELLFQGNLSSELEALLLGDPSLTSHGGAQNSPYRVPKGCVEVTLRKGVPAKKNTGSGAAKKK